MVSKLGREETALNSHIQMIWVHVSEGRVNFLLGFTPYDTTVSFK